MYGEAEGGRIMCQGDYTRYLEYLRNNLKLALGCTEPAAIALAGAKAYSQIGGELEKVDVTLGINMYKNALYVGIPGLKVKGIDMALLLGIHCGNPEDELEIFDRVTEEGIERALATRELVNIHINKEVETVLIDVTIHTSNGKSRCKIEDSHTHTTLLEVNDEVVMIKPNLMDKNHDIAADYEDFIDNIDKVAVEEFQYVLDSLDLLEDIIKAGLGNGMPLGIGGALQSFMMNGLLANDVINNTAVKISAAAEARLSGSQISVMSCGGSGSQGVATIIPIIEMAKHMHVSRKRKMKAIIVGYATTLYTKRVLGRLSSVCGCAIASSIGATVGIIWMQGGLKKEMQGGINNVVGSLTGVICDGAKIGCAFKMAMGAIMAIYSALLAVDDVFLDVDNGIIGDTISETIENMGTVSSKGMPNMNSVIVDIMEHKAKTCCSCSKEYPS